MKTFKWIAGNVFNIIGVFLAVMGLPFGISIFSRGLDAVIFIPLGVLLIGISYYYKFIDR